MKLRSSRISKRRAPLRLQSDSHQTILVPRRQSSRLKAKLRSISILHSLETNCKPKNLFKQLLTDPEISHPSKDILDTHLPTSRSNEVSLPVPSSTQFQEYSYPPQIHNHQTRNRRSVEDGTERPSKRARLTEKNLKAFEKMRGRQRKSAGKKSTGQSSTTTITDKDFGTKLQRNQVVYTSFDARAPDDVAKARELLDRRRESEPPDRLDYNEYLVLTEDYENELGVEISAYPLLAKRTLERGISGYFQRPNHSWSAVDNHLTTGLSDTQPDLVESYRKTDYPLIATEALSGDLAPSSYNEAMPAYAVEFKSTNGDMKEAKLQCAYDGALMTEGAHAIHTYLGKPDDDFYGRTQALTVAFNGETLNFYAHHAVQIPTSSHPTTGRGVDRNAGVATDTAATIKYHQYLLNCDNPRVSFEAFQTAYKHTRNAQDIGYKWATERKDALWAYTNGDNIQTSPNIPTSAQQPPNDSLVSISSGTPDGYNCDADNDEVDPTDQLLRESWTDNGYASPDTQTHNPVTPPLSSKDVSAPLEPQQLSVPTVTEPREDVDFNTRDHRKTRARTHHAVAVEGAREIVDNSKSRKTRKR